MPGLGHIAVGMAAGRRISGRARAMAAFAALAMLPDLDVIGFRFGVPYGSPFGHRGAAHSLLVAAIVGALFALAGIRFAGWRAGPAFALAIAVAASHGLLDTMTDGGRGVAVFWPFADARYFAPWRPIPVAPIGAGMMSARGLHVTLVEAAEFAPFLLYALWPRPRRT